MIAQGNVLGRIMINVPRTERAMERMKGRWGKGPLPCATVMDAMTQGVALGYRPLPRWGVNHGGGARQRFLLAMRAASAFS